MKEGEDESKEGEKESGVGDEESGRNMKHNEEIVEKGAEDTESVPQHETDSNAEVTSELSNY